MALTGLDDPGLTVFPTHRLLSGFPSDPERQRRLGEGLRELFEVEEVETARVDPLGADGSRRLRPLRLPPQAGFRLRLKDGAIAALDRGLEGMPEAYRRLDAAILETLVLKGLAEISEDDILAKRGIGYAKSVDDSLRCSRTAPTTSPSSSARSRSTRSGRSAKARRTCRPSRPTSTPRSSPASSSTRLADPHRRVGSAVVKIYTKKGDDGTTSLWYGGRVPKHHGRTEAYGALDEAARSSALARALCGAGEEELAADILRLQDDIFIAAAELATAPQAAARLEDGVSRHHRGRWSTSWSGESTATWARSSCRRSSSSPAATRSPPSSTSPAPSIRRAERRISALAEDGELASETVIHFVNRASDLAYAMARFADVDDPGPVRGAPEGRAMKVVARRRRGLRPRGRDRGRPHDRRRRAARGRRHRHRPHPDPPARRRLAGCMAVTMELYAERKGWDVARSRSTSTPTTSGHLPRSFEVTLRLPAELTTSSGSACS